MTQPSAITEPYLRMAISNLNNAVGYIMRIPDCDNTHISWAIGDIETAVSRLMRYARLNDIELREGMKT